MWVIQLNTADWVSSKTQILLVTLKTRKQLQGESCASSEVEHCSHQVACARNEPSVSHSSTESGIIFMDVGLRMDGILALAWWDVVSEVSHSSNNVPPTPTIPAPKSKSRTAAGHCVRDNVHNIRLKGEGDRNVDQLSNLDRMTTNAHSSQCEAQLYISEDNEPVIEMVIKIKGRSPMMRHVSRTHRAAMGGLFDRIMLDPKIQIKYFDTRSQLADLLTTGSFTRDE